MAPGASVRVEAPIGEPSPSVVVPASALRRGPEGDHVFVLAEDAEGATRAGLRFVQAGGGIGNHVVIRGGLAAGERVAASGSFKLRESVLVAVQDEPATGFSSR
jgi:membrane fusion protein (multidrug efflux system)